MKAKQPACKTRIIVRHYKHDDDKFFPQYFNGKRWRFYREYLCKVWHYSKRIAEHEIELRRKGKWHLRKWDIA